jgi:hypothetical protein
MGARVWNEIGSGTTVPTPVHKELGRCGSRRLRLPFGLGLFVAAGAGLTGTWALVVSTIAMGLAGLVAVVVLEDRDYAAVEGLYPVASDPLDGAVTEHPAEEGMARAA